MRIDSFDLFDTTKLVIHEHDEVRKINNTAKTGIILLRGTPPDNTFPLSLFLIIPHPTGRGFKVSVGGMPHSARIGRALFHRARSASKKDIWPLPRFPFSTTSQSSRHLHLLPDLPHGTPSHRASLSSRLSTTL